LAPAPGSPVAVGAYPHSLAAADLNGDGALDLAVADFHSNDVTVLLGTGTGGFIPASGSPITTGGNPLSVAVADFDGDGTPDLAVTNQASNDVTISFNHGRTTTTVTSSAGQAVYGQDVRFTATVTSASGLAPAGSITFWNGPTVLGTATVSSGTASVDFSTAGPLPAGGYAVTATFDSDSFDTSASAQLAQNVATAQTTTTLGVPLKPPAAGQPVTLAATVIGSDGAGLGGFVTFRDGTTVLGSAPLVGDTATLPVQFGSTGTHAVTAQFLGDGNDLLSASAAAMVSVVGTAHKIVAGTGAGGGRRSACSTRTGRWPGRPRPTGRPSAAGCGWPSGTLTATGSPT
jgi:hypothetical protein